MSTRTYHPMVYVLLLGTALTSLTSSMSVFFLPVYLMHRLHTDPLTIGCIVGASALTATVGGFVGGTLSDFIGRKLLVLASLLVLSAVFLGFVTTSNVPLLLLLNAIRGVCSSFFAVVSKALMADLTLAEQRFRVFSNRYLAGNVGYAIGPVVGANLGIAGNVWAFMLAALVYFVYFVLMVVMIRFVHAHTHPEDGPEKASLPQAWGVLRQDTVLLLFIVGSAVLTTVHGEMSVTLSQYLSTVNTDGGKLFGYLMSVNGLTVLLIQVFISRWSGRFQLFTRLALGCSLFTVGEIGFSFSKSWAAWVISMIVFTIGEILIIPSEYAQIDEITTDGMRGMYYGAQSFNEIGNVVGPWFGGFLLVSFGGQTMFLTMALLSQVGLLFYALGRKKQFRRHAGRWEDSKSFLNT